MYVRRHVCIYMFIHVLLNLLCLRPIVFALFNLLCCMFVLLIQYVLCLCVYIQSDLSYPIYPVPSPSIAVCLLQINLYVCIDMYLTYPVPSVNPEIYMKQMCADK